MSFCILTFNFVKKNIAEHIIDFPESEYVLLNLNHLVIDLL